MRKKERIGRIAEENVATSKEMNLGQHNKGCATLFNIIYLYWKCQIFTEFNRNFKENCWNFKTVLQTYLPKYTVSFEAYCRNWSTSTYLAPFNIFYLHYFCNNKCNYNTFMFFPWLLRKKKFYFIATLDV